MANIERKKESKDQESIQSSTTPEMGHNMGDDKTQQNTTHKRAKRRGERSGSVVECLTRDPRATGSSLTGVTALWSLSKTHFS